MCGDLVLTCIRLGDFNTWFSDHHLIHGERRIPCKKPGSAECRTGKAELMEFQNPPTSCAGAEQGWHPRSVECEEICKRSLQRYGEALYRVNTSGPTVKAGWCGRLKRMVFANKKGRKQESAPLLRSVDSSGDEWPEGRGR